MAISVDWPTRVITIPKADSSLVDSGPPEIRQLDVDAFRLELKALEDNEEGINFPKTHNHTTEYTISGVTYARAVQIVNGYTITFENGSYIMTFAGANHNIQDVTNYNSVQTATSNSGGLINASVQAFWDALRADHVVVDSFGEAVDAKISTRSSHDDPDPSGYLDAAISGRAQAGDAMDLVTDAVDELSIDSTILARLMASASVTRIDARENLGFVITVGAGSHTGTLCVASDQASKALKGKPGLVLTGSNEGRAIRFTTDSDGSGSFGYTDWVGEGFATPLSQTDTIQA